ncbi:MAG: ATP-binding protein [Nannocystaceae bacterium]
MAPALAIVAVAAALWRTSPAEEAASILGQVAGLGVLHGIVATSSERLPPWIEVALVPVIACALLVVGPMTFAAPWLWLIAPIVVFALPRPAGPWTVALFGAATAIAADVGLALADAATGPMALAAAVIGGATIVRAVSRQNLEDPDGQTLALRERLAEEQQAAQRLRQERGELERDFEDRIIALQTQTRTLQRELQERRATEEQALEASRIKSSFLANISHELRTPLNAIIGYSEMLIEDLDGRGDQETAKDQRSVLAAAHNLQAIVDNVLDLTKIEAGKAEVQIEVFPVIELVESLGNTALPLARKNNNTLKLKYARELGYIKTDRAKLHRILLNLLSNACKFTHDGRIELRVDEEVIDERRYFLFSIADTGIGISPEAQTGLFEAFRMADESSTREYGGLGLGLALAKSFTELLSGSLTVESAPGKGSVFRVRLPVEAEDPRKAGHILVSMF